MLLANFASGATEADARALEPLMEVMPKAFGNTGTAPLLPTLPPAKGLVPGSLRYALGPVSVCGGGGSAAGGVAGLEDGAGGGDDAV